MSVKGEIYVLCVCVFVFSFIYCWVFISCLVSWNKCTSCEVLDPLLSIQKQCVFWNWAHSKMRIFIINLHCFPFPSKITFPLSFSFFLSLNSLYFYVNIFFFSLQLEDLLSPFWPLVLYVPEENHITSLILSCNLLFIFHLFGSFFSLALLTSFHNLSTPPVCLDVLCHSLTFFLNSLHFLIQTYWPVLDSL